MPEIRTQDVTYTIEQPRFATTGANKGEIAFDLVVSAGGHELTRESHTLGGEAMAKYMFGRPDSAKTRWQDSSECLYAAALEPGLIQE